MEIKNDLYDIHNIQIIKDNLSLDCKIKADISNEEKEITINIPKMKLKGSLIKSDTSSRGYGMQTQAKIYLEIECLVPDTGDKTFLTVTENIDDNKQESQRNKELINKIKELLIVGEI